MPAALVLLIVLVTILVVAAIVPWVLIARWKKRRRVEVADYARRREWEYRASDPTLLDRFHGPPFTYGHGNKAENVLLGQYGGRPFVAFDLQVDTTTSIAGHGAGAIVWYSVAALNLGTTVPDLSVGPKGVLGRLLAGISDRDVPIGNAELDEGFSVRSPSPAFARAVLNRDVVALVLAHCDNGWRLDGDSILMLSPRVLRRPPEEIEERLALMDQILGLVPPGAWRTTG
ncbi:hypothetical protein [Nocardioides sp. MH1]|uniref:hypothetical protein n=1 Tax=Nocardioides sp. MH1 TaxID=3242490 RepID=UPI003521834B